MENKNHFFAEDSESFPENKSSILHKDLDLNLEEQRLLKKRIYLSEEKLKTIGKEDPEYSVVQLEIKSDQVQLDELMKKEELIKDQIKGSS